jgi:spermidine synthase
MTPTQTRPDVSTDLLVADAPQVGESTARPSHLRWVYILFFVSGFPALIYQIVWQRALFTIYGVNIESVTLVVGAFMLGLGLGSLLGGMVSRIPRLPVLAAFGCVELSIGAFGVISLPLFHWVGIHTAGSSAAATGALTFLLVLIPTILMGGTLPFLVSYLVRISRNVGESVGILYFVNTLGSATACLASATFLMRLLGEQGSVTLAAGINITLGVVAIAAHLLFPDRTSGFTRLEAIAENAGPVRVPIPLFPFSAALWIVGASGFVALSYEIVWYRAYSFVSGSQARSFSSLLGAYLAGVAFGSLFSKGLCRKLGAVENRRRHLSLISMLAIAANVFGFLVVPFVAYAAHAVNYIVTLPLVVISAGLLGAVFPLVTHISVAPDRRSGARLSYLYLANIVGSALGTVLVGFILMDHLSMRGLSVFLVVLGLTMGAVIAAFAVDGARRFAVLAGVAALALGAAAIAQPLFNTVYERMLYKVEYGPGLKFAHLVESRSGVIGVSANTTVFGGGVYDGKFNTSLVHDTSLATRVYAVSAFHPQPREVLMIGLSSGSWAQIVANHPTVERLTVVEINPGYLKLIPQYPAVASILHNPKTTIIIDDGRRWLVSNPQRKFDLIVMNSSYHWRAHMSNLLSTAFLKLVRSHLTPGGALFYNTTASGEVMLTGATVFPYAMRVINFLAVSDQPLVFDKDALTRALTAYRIDGKPLLDLTQAADQKKLSELLAWGDTPGGPDPATAPIEYADTIRQRFKDKRIITDDNMGTEWY